MAVLRGALSLHASSPTIGLYLWWGLLHIINDS